MALKLHFPEVRFSGIKVSPDEMDIYEQYQVINPAISATFFGSATAGTVSQVVAIGLGNTRADFPRNIATIWSGSADVSGTVAVTGKNQFGVTITESIALANGTQTSGTTAGTKVFAQVTAATATFGTGVVGTGTVSLGVPLVGTSAFFGLPSKIAGSTDVKLITWSNSTGLSIPLNGGTIGAFVDATQHAFRGTATLAGTMTLTALFRSTFLDETSALESNL